jgi:hypothetical protein
MEIQFRSDPYGLKYIRENKCNAYRKEQISLDEPQIVFKSVLTKVFTISCSKDFPVPGLTEDITEFCTGQL